MAASRVLLVLRFSSMCRVISRPSLSNSVIWKALVQSPKELNTRQGLLYTPLRQLTTSSVRWDGNDEQEQDDSPAKVHAEPTEAELLQAREYLQSEEYIERYGKKPVWANYKRNHKGRIPPLKTRKRCIRGTGEKKRVCGNPCPICRDDNLVIHYKNPKLLEQFICSHSWNTYSTYRTGVCQWQYKKLCATIEKARQHGLLEYTVPFIKYNYKDYFPKSSDGGTESDARLEEKEAKSAL